jgi:hypothetical protein
MNAVCCAIFSASISGWLAISGTDSNSWTRMWSSDWWNCIRWVILSRSSTIVWCRMLAILSSVSFQIACSWSLIVFMVSGLIDLGQL